MSASDAHGPNHREVARQINPSPLVPTTIGTGTPHLLSPSPVPDVYGLLSALRRRLGLAIGLGMICSLVVAVVAWLVVPPAKYTTRATLRVSMNRPQIMFDTHEKEADYATFQKTQIDLMKSRDVLFAVLQNPEIAKLSTVRDALKTQGDPVDWLERQLTVDFPSRSEILSVTMSGSLAKDLPVLVNEVVARYMKDIVGEDDVERTLRNEKLRKLVDGYQETLKKKRKILKEMAAEAGGGDRTTLATNSQVAHETLSIAKSEQIGIRSELYHARADLAALEAITDNGQEEVARPIVPDEVIEDALDRHPIIDHMRPGMATLKGKLNNAMRLARSQRDPAVVAAQRDYDAVRKAIDDERTRLRPQVTASFYGTLPSDTAEMAQGRKKLVARIKLLDQFEKDLSKQIDQLNTQITKLSTNTLDIQSEQDEITTLAETAKKVGAELEGMEVERQAPARIKKMNEAYVPGVKDELKKAKVIGASALATFAFVLTGISLWEFRSRRISSTDEVVHGLGMTLVGSLPAMPPVQPANRLSIPGSAGRLADYNSRLVESVDATRTMLLHASRVDGIRVVMIVSALEGEGKTSLSCHLATSLARAGRRTLLIDCDLRRPAAHRLLDVAAGPGISELLRGEIELVDVVRPTRAADLFVIPAGRVDFRALQGLARGSLQSILDVVSPEYDFVIIDTAPILPVADTLSICQHVDAVIFSILRDVSRLPMVNAAYGRMASLGVRILGAVVSGTPTHAYATRYSYSSQEK